MKRSFPPVTQEAVGPDRAIRFGAGPLFVLLLAGLLTDVAPNDEAYAGIDYALSLLALLGAAGCIVGLTVRLALGLDPLPWTGPAASGLPAAVALANVSERGEDWPLLVALLFGPLVILLAGLGGWV